MTHNKMIIGMLLISAVILGLNACAGWKPSEQQKDAAVEVGKKVVEYAFDMLLDQFLKVNVGIEFTSGRSLTMIMKRHTDEARDIDMAYLFEQDAKKKWRLTIVMKYAALQELQGKK